MNNIQEKKLSEKKIQNFLELVQSGLSGNVLLIDSLNDICVMNEDAECSCLRQNVVSRKITERYPGSESMCKSGNTSSNINKGCEVEVEVEAEVEVEVGSNGNTRDDNGDPTIAQWPFHTQCIMACAAVISLLYDDTIMNAHIIGCHYNNGTNDCNKRHFLSTNHPFYKRTYLLFQIIARLPQNIHAISRVTTVQTIRSTLPLSGSTASPSTATATSTSTSSPLKRYKNVNDENNENNENNEDNENNEENEEEIEEEIIQERAGFGLFLCASAVNHSCAPNCTVRFQFKNESKLNFSTVSDAIEISKKMKSVNNGEMKNDDVNRKIKLFSEKEDLQLSYRLEQLTNVRLELVCTKKVLKGSQCFISYGPLASQQTMKERKEFLKNQYLFSCLCSVCGENIENKNGNETRSKTKIVKNCDIRSLDNIVSTTNVPQNSCMKNVISSYDANSVILVKLNILNNLLSSLRQNLKEINEIFHDIKSRKIINFNKRIEIFEIFDKNRVQPIRELLSSVEIDYFSGDFGEVLNAKTFGDINMVDIETNNNIKSKYKKIISSMYTEYCKIYCQIYDISAHISNTIGKHVSTCTFLRKNIDRMTCSRSVGSYAKDDVVVGRERVKLAQAFYLLGDLKKR